MKKIAVGKAVKGNKIKKVSAKVSPEEKDIFALTGDNALLLAEGCKLTKEKKAAEKRIKEIKTALGFRKKGEYTNKAGDALTLSLADKFTEIDPEKLFNLFVKNRKKKKFWMIVKVQIGPLAKIIPESSIKKLREKLDPTKKWSFK